MKAKNKKPGHKTDGQELKRSLTFPVVALYGLGNILGAGIYVLIGKVAGAAGAGTLLAFMAAMVAAALTAFSYMELSSRFPATASISVYYYQAFKRRWLSLAAGFATILAGITSAAALAHGFGGYLSVFAHTPTLLGAIIAILALGLLALYGIGESAKLAAVFTLVEAAGLIFVLWVSRSAFSGIEAGELLRLDTTLGASGLVAGAFLAFYAFIGFEDMVNVAEETKNPRRTMPIAILVAFLTATVLYILIVAVSLVTVSSSELANSNAPLALVMSLYSDEGQYLLAAVGMVATLNGIIVNIIMGSRTLHGLAKQGWIHPHFARVHRRFRTPHIATFTVLGSMLLATIALPLLQLASITSFVVLLLFVGVNLALIVVKRRIPITPRQIRVPGIIPVLGVAVCLFIVSYQLWQWLI